MDGFAGNGYVVIRPDYRGHDKSEGKRAAYGRPDYTIDVLNAPSTSSDTRRRPERIGMWGHSMGGDITLRSMVTTKDIKAGVIWAGVVASYPDPMSRWRRPCRSSGRPARGDGATIRGAVVGSPRRPGLLGVDLAEAICLTYRVHCSSSRHSERERAD